MSCGEVEPVLAGLSAVGVRGGGFASSVLSLWQESPLPPPANIPGLRDSAPLVPPAKAVICGDRGPLPAKASRSGGGGAGLGERHRRDPLVALPPGTAPCLSGRPLSAGSRQCSVDRRRNKTRGLKRSLGGSISVSRGNNLLSDAGLANKINNCCLLEARLPPTKSNITAR